MSQLEKQIAQRIQEIADGTRGRRFPVMSGKVVAGSVDETEGSCKVVLSKDDTDAPTESVTLSAVLENRNGFILYPADNSDVLVAEIDGPNKYGVIMCSTITKAAIMFNATAGADHCVTMIDTAFDVRNGDYKFHLENGKIVLTANHSSLTGTDALWKFNDGSYDGLVRVGPLVGKLNALESDLTSLKAQLTAWIVALTPSSTVLTGSVLAGTMGGITTYASSAIATTAQNDIENPHITHGPHG